jgi:tyrosinase
MAEFNPFSRRDFLKGIGTLGVASLGMWAGGCDSCVQQISNEIKNRPTRKNIQKLWDANPSDPVITTYKAAVKAMKALPSSNPSSWEFQKNIHLNKCIHRNWLWLPWHRAYLVYFERICRKVTGDDKFALPYWNWNEHPAVPDPFWESGSPLNDPNRGGLTQSDKAPSSVVGTTAVQTILNETSFELFASGPPPSSNLHDGPFTASSGLEVGPHNGIHGFVSGPLGTGDMGQFYSPLDPVFYTHHCMCDCLWTHWNNDLGNANTNDTSWTNFALTDFFDENGNPTSVAVATTVLMPLVTYQYEPCSLAAAAGGAGGRIKLSGKQLEQFLRTGAPSKLEFVQRFELRQAVTAEAGKPATIAIKVDKAVLGDALQRGPHTRIVLTVADIEIPGKKDFFTRVFVNKPDATGDTSIDDPHYAGSFAFFPADTGMNHGDSAAAPSHVNTGCLVDVTETLQSLNKAGSLTDEVSVSLVPVRYFPGEAAGEFLTLQRLELGVVRF